MGTKEELGAALKGAARILPGIGSYQDKESIRETDKKLREFLSSQLLDQVRTLERRKTGIARGGSLSFLKDLDDLTRRMDKLSRSLGFASRGYAPLFNSSQVNEDALRKLFEFDKSLKKDIDQVELVVAKISEKTEGLDPDLVKDLDESLSRVEKRIGERERLLKTEHSAIS
jgi:hypothetical protein